MAQQTRTTIPTPVSDAAGAGASDGVEFLFVRSPEECELMKSGDSLSKVKNESSNDISDVLPGSDFSIEKHTQEFPSFPGETGVIRDYGFDDVTVDDLVDQHFKKPEWMDGFNPGFDPREQAAVTLSSMRHVVMNESAAMMQGAPISKTQWRMAQRAMRRPPTITLSASSSSSSSAAEEPPPKPVMRRSMARHGIPVAGSEERPIVIDGDTDSYEEWSEDDEGEKEPSTKKARPDNWSLSHTGKGYAESVWSTTYPYETREMLDLDAD